MSQWEPTNGCERPILRFPTRPRAASAEEPLVLQDLGYVEGHRVHVVPAWTVRADEGLETLLERLGRERPEADTVVLSAGGPVVEREAVALRRDRPSGPALVLARHRGDTFATSEPEMAMADVATVEVGAAAFEEASAFLARLAWSRASAEGALALAGFWYGTAQVGADVVIVLANLEPLPPAAAA